MKRRYSKLDESLADAAERAKVEEIKLICRDKRLAYIAKHGGDEDS